jgi:hypothetical protein
MQTFHYENTTDRLKSQGFLHSYARQANALNVLVHLQGTVAQYCKLLNSCINPSQVEPALLTLFDIFLQS